MEKKREWAVRLTFIGVAFIGCGMFPFINLTKETPVRMDTMNLLIMLSSVMFYYTFGKLEANVFSEKPALYVAFFNVTATAFGMLIRFLLEFGEISNDYNFTLLNIALQLFAALILTSGAWFFHKNATLKQ